jgi:hypothetical protein
VKAIKDYFGSELHWYGNGVNSLEEKWMGIAPYKYHIVLENQSRNNIITEKLYDSFLGLAFPIYYGAPNVGDFFDKNSLEIIDIYDLKNSIKIIENLIISNKWDESETKLIENKNKVINKFNLFYRISEIAKNNEKFNNNLKEKIKLKSIKNISNKNIKKKILNYSLQKMQDVSYKIKKINNDL